VVSAVVVQPECWRDGSIGERIVDDQSAAVEGEEGQTDLGLVASLSGLVGYIGRFLQCCEWIIDKVPKARGGAVQ